jgi:hypothetical protein
MPPHPTGLKPGGGLGQVAESGVEEEAGEGEKGDGATVNGVWSRPMVARAGRWSGAVRVGVGPGRVVRSSSNRPCVPALSE